MVFGVYQKLFKDALAMSVLKKIGRNQLYIDPGFEKEVAALKRKRFRREISNFGFWQQYKKALLKSAAKNKKILQQMLKIVDKKITKQFREADKKEKKGPKPEFPDLSLPA
jgi:hypothetical protein